MFFVSFWFSFVLLNITDYENLFNFLDIISVWKNIFKFKLIYEGFFNNYAKFNY